MPIHISHLLLTTQWLRIPGRQRDHLKSGRRSRFREEDSGIMSEGMKSTEGHLQHAFLHTMNLGDLLLHC